LIEIIKEEYRNLSSHNGDCETFFCHLRDNALNLAACFMLVSCLAYSSTLKMEGTRSSETSVAFIVLEGVTFKKTELLIREK
jgi:hypothetical protein